MIKKDQIEKMAIDLEEEFALCGTLSSCGTKRCSRCFSKYLYEQGYRKLPEDSVVLSREEYDEIKTYQSYIPEMKKAFDKIRIATIKETAREILNELIDSSNKITFFDCRMALGLDKLAKQFGLEIKE